VCIVFLPNPPIAISNLPCCSSHGEVTFIKSCYFNEFHIVILMSFIAIFPLLSYGFVAYVNKNCDLKSRIRKIDVRVESFYSKFKMANLNQNLIISILCDFTLY
jgi:hypothetical protein